MKTGSQTFIKYLGPGQTVSIEQGGDFFWLIECPIALDIKTGSGSFNPYVQDTGEDYSRVGEFARLELRNPTLADIIVIIYVGWSRYVSSRSSVIEPPTKAVGWNDDTIPANDGVNFSGIPSGTQLRRKCIQVTNEDQTLKLHLRDASGNVILAIFPETSITLPISELVEVYNPNGTPITARVSEIFWMSQANVS